MFTSIWELIKLTFHTQDTYGLFQITAWILKFLRKGTIYGEISYTFMDILLHLGVKLYIYGFGTFYFNLGVKLGTCFMDILWNLGVKLGTFSQQGRKLEGKSRLEQRTQAKLHHLQLHHPARPVSQS